MTPLQEQFAQVVGGQYLEAYLALPFCLALFPNSSSVKNTPNMTNC